MVLRYSVLMEALSILKYHPRYYKKEKLLVVLSISSILTHLIAFLYYRYLMADSRVLCSFLWQFEILTGASFILAVLTLLIYRNTEKGVLPWLIGQWVIILMLGYPLGTNLLIEALFISGLLIQTIILESSARSSIITGVLMLISFTLFQHRTRYMDFDIPAPSSMDLLVFVFLLLCLSMIVVFVKFLFSKTRYQEVKIHQLNTAADRLIKANRSFQEYAYEIEQKSITKERLRLSRELHDIVGYTMVNINMMMEDAIDKHIQKDTDLVFPLIVSTRDLARNSHQEIREALKKFRDSRQIKRPFLNELSTMINVFSEASGVNVELKAPQSFSFLTQNLCFQLLRIIQEGLTNAIHHGHARKIEIILVRNQTGITLVISDNGLGAETIKEGIGITGMRERLNTVNGSLAIKSDKGSFKLTINIPTENEGD